MSAPRCSLIVIAFVAITGCTLHPDLVAAYVKDGSEAEIVEVTLRSSDARAIKDREIYFSIVVVDCENRQKQFPIQPYVEERLASKFDFSVAGEHVTLHGAMPQHVLADYPRPCVFLRGGSYSLGKIESATVRLVRKGSTE